MFIELESLYVVMLKLIVSRLIVLIDYARINVLSNTHSVS
jgi:hypothetical protein